MMVWLSENPIPVIIILGLIIWFDYSTYSD